MGRETLLRILEWSLEMPDIAREGLEWYDQAREDCAMIARCSGFSLEQAVAVTVALSPQMRWERNIYHAMRLLQAVRDGLPIPSIPTYRVNLEKALKALEMEDPSVLFDPEKTPKTWSFYRNILGDPDPVTVDRHMYALWEFSTGSPVRPSLKQYQVIREAVRDISGMARIQPRQAQAVLWVAWRSHRKAVMEAMEGKEVVSCAWS
jgi:hypothetical protein